MYLNDPTVTSIFSQRLWSFFRFYFCFPFFSFSTYSIMSVWLEAFFIYNPLIPFRARWENLWRDLLMNKSLTLFKSTSRVDLIRISGFINKSIISKLKHKHMNCILQASTAWMITNVNAQLLTLLISINGYTQRLAVWMNELINIHGLRFVCCKKCIVTRNIKPWNYRPDVCYWSWLNDNGIVRCSCCR